MSQVHFSHAALFLLLWLVPPLVILSIVSIRVKRRHLRRLAARLALPGRRDRRRRDLRTGIAILSVVFIVLASVGVGVAPHAVKVRQRGREVVFLVDVSRSMLARDLAPNRLARAKSAIIGALPQMRDDRVALVAFAGSASIICPLTYDHTFFAESVDRLSTSSVSVGGSKIGDAIRYATRRVFPKGDKAHRDIILISDGGDQGSYPVRAASEAGSKGVRILTIGLGNQKSGTRIPVSAKAARYVTYHGRVVTSKLNATLLRNIAEATPGGRFLDVATGTFDLGSIYHAFIGEAPKSALGTRTVTQYRPLFQYFLLGALLLLIAEVLIPERPRVEVEL